MNNYSKPSSGLCNFGHCLIFTLVLSTMSTALAQRVGYMELILEEVIVTAQKREQVELMVPITLTVLSEEEMARRSANLVSDAVEIVPNIYVENNFQSNPSISIRGVSTNTNNVGLEAGIGMAVDGISMGRPSYYNTAMIDINRVEVLRGPQGTLFGKNTTGGLLNIISNKPQREFDSAGNLNFGNYGLQQFRGYITGGNDTVSGRLAITARKTDGWAEDRTVGNDNLQREDFRGARGQVLFNASERLSILLQGFASEDDGIMNFQDVLGGVLFALDGMDGGDRSIATNDTNFWKRDIRGLSMDIEWRGNGLTFNSLSAAMGNEVSNFNDQDYTVANLLKTGRREDQEQISQEFRLSSNGDEAFNWTIGAYYFNQEQVSDQGGFIAEDIIPILASLGLPLPPSLPGYEEGAVTFANIDTESIAGFVTASFKFSETWTLSGGLRYTKEDKDLEYKQDLVLWDLFPGFPLNLVVPLGFADTVPLTLQSRSDSEPSGDISLSYSPNEDLNVYGRFAHGFKAGGFDTTTSPTADPGDLTFEPEFIDSFEIGVKTYLADRRLRLNASVFYLDWKDKQEQFFNGINFLTSNAASASNKGFEFELLALLTSDLELTVALGNQNAKYDEYIDELTGQDFSDNKLARAPDWSGYLGLNYERRMAGGWSLMLYGDARYRDNSFLDAANTTTQVQESNTVVNGRLGVSSPSGRYSIAVWGKNLTKEDYLVGGFSFFGTDYGGVNAPRTYGIEFRANL